MSLQAPQFVLQHPLGSQASGLGVNMLDSSKLVCDANGQLHGLTQNQIGSLILLGWSIVSAS